jgi:hypothetical protein
MMSKMLNVVVVFVFQVEQMLSTEDHGKDLASVQNLLKKHQLMEADIAAHEVCTQTFYVQNVLLDASDQMFLMKVGYCCISSVLWNSAGKTQNILCIGTLRKRCSMTKDCILSLIIVSSLV